MSRRLLFIILLFILPVMYTGIKAQPSFCIPTITYGCLQGDIIRNVSFGSLTHMDSGCNGGANGYIQYPESAYTTTVFHGENVPFLVSSGTQYPQYLALWIDFNNDGDFEDSGEWLGATSQREYSFAGFVTIPDHGSIEGPRRLRVRSSWDVELNALSACTSAIYGETEDYTITVSPLQFFSGGQGDGFSRANTSFFSPFHPLWAGSTGDGFTNLGSSLQTPYIPVFSGGIHDGYSMWNAVFTNPFPPVFSGSAGDGYASCLATASINPWCIPVVEEGCGVSGGTFVNSVTIHTLNNVASGCNANPNGYIRYPSGDFTTSLIQAQSYPMQVTTGNSNPCYIGVWADWNDDKDFDDASEFLFASTERLFSCSFDVIPPSGIAYYGLKKLRVRAVYDFQLVQASSCTGANYGETEDYSIMVMTAADKLLDITFLPEGLVNEYGNLNKIRMQNGILYPGDTACMCRAEIRSHLPPCEVLLAFDNLALDTHGICRVQVPGIWSGTYYLVVSTSNHLAVWSSAPVNFSAALVSYDFSVSAAQAFGSNQKSLGGRWALFAGDVNQDGVIQNSDMDLISHKAASFSGSNPLTDLNGDGITDALDVILVDNNAAAFVSIKTPE